MNPKTADLTRRKFLAGVGCTIALPWLEALPFGLAQTANTAAPKRLAVLFMGNGISPPNWSASGAGNEMTLSRTLEPLAPYKNKLNIISGLFNRAATGVGIHPGQTGNILSGAALQRGAVLRGGVSMDQVLANYFDDVTPQPSLVLGCEQPITGYHETNFSMAYSSHISWQNINSPVPMEVYPSLAFDSLFDNQGSRRTASILDRVRDQTAELNRQVSGSDRAKLDEYLNSVREVERRVQRVTPSESPRTAVRGESRPANGLPEDIREHMRLMCDIIALGFQTDKTRVATLLMCRDLSGLFYPFLNVRTAHHPTSHEDHSDAYERVSRYYVSQAAYLAGRLNEMREGERTVLDNSCILWLSNMWSGSQHDSRKVPLFTIGGLGGMLETGRVLNYLDRGDDNRKLCSLYVSLMNRMGVRTARFGDAASPLAGL